jgi:hypothetical protein
MIPAPARLPANWVVCSSSPQVKSTDAGPRKVHKSTLQTFSPRARTNLCNARRRLPQCQCRRRRGFQRPRPRQHGGSDATTAHTAHKAQRRMPVRVPVEWDTLLRRGLGDSSRVAEQVRPREGGPLSQSSSSHTHARSQPARASTPLPLR